MAAGPSSVALFGKSMSMWQKALIGSAWKDGTAVVLLDGDADAEAQRIHAELEGMVRHRVLVTPRRRRTLVNLLPMFCMSTSSMPPARKGLTYRARHPGRWRHRGKIEGKKQLVRSLRDM